ncbi:MAG: deoxyribonuclease IV [Candidatus Micrarchaeaceae archaeon]
MNITDFMLALGRHVSIAGSVDMAFGRAAAIGCTAMQIFVTNPRGWTLSQIDEQPVSAFREKARATGITAIAHMPYLPNIASSNPASLSKSVKSLKENMERCNSLGIGYLVTHMGSHLGKGKEGGLSRVVDSVNAALDSAGGTKILLENEAGHKNSVGDRIEDLVKVYDEVGNRRLGFCLDTCHLFAAGYDITKEAALDEMFNILSVDKVFAVHLNDAKKELGSRIDRHANIGFGHIGKEGFRKFLNYGKVHSKIIILETPEGPGIGEAEEIELVREMIA